MGIPIGEDFNRRAPFEHALGPTDPGHLLRTGLAYLRFGTIALGILLMLVGLYLAITVFGVVRGVVETPDTFMAYLDSWERALGGPDELFAEPAAESKDAEAGPPPDQTAKVPIRRPKPRSSSNSSWDAFLEGMAEAARAGAIARPLGALFILMFTLVLVRIPLSIILTGNRIVMALVIWKKDEQTRPRVPREAALRVSRRRVRSACDEAPARVGSPASDKPHRSHESDPSDPSHWSGLPAALAREYAPFDLSQATLYCGGPWIS